MDLRELSTLSATGRSRGDGSSKLVAILLGLVCALSACAGADEAGAHRFIVTVEDGVEVALTTGGPRYEGEILERRGVLPVLAPDSAVRTAANSQACRPRT